MTRQRICLIGGSGFLGGYLAEALGRAGHAVTIATRSRERQKAGLIVQPFADLVTCDTGDQDALTDLIAGHDCVIGMAGILHGSARQFDAVHIGLTDRILAACRDAGVRRLLHVSALGADPDASSDYQRSKGIAETHVRDSGLDWTILRPSVIFGRGDNFLTLFARLQAVLPCMPLAGSQTLFQPVWAADVARLMTGLPTRPDAIGRTVDVAGPHRYTLAELVRYAGALAGHPRPVLPLPEWAGLLQAFAMECLPGPALMSRDNVRSLRRDNISDAPFGGGLADFDPTPLEAVAPAWLGRAGTENRIADWRAAARR